MFSRKKRSAFITILIPLLIVIVFQAFLTYGTILFGGTTKLLQDNSLKILHQNVTNRHIMLQNEMIQRWSNINECVETVNESAEKLGNPQEALQEKEVAQKFLLEASGTMLYTMRKNSVTGVFLVLSNGQNQDYSGASQNLEGLYFRDLDPLANPGDYSDILMERGSSEISNQLHVALDSYWSAKFNNTSSQEMEYYYKPFLAALENPKIDFKNLGYWSSPFYLDKNKGDSYEIITYSVPLIDGVGRVYGVLGIEISVKQFVELMPSWEIAPGQRGGYMLLSYNQEESQEAINARIEFLSGAGLRRMILPGEQITLEQTGDFAGMYQFKGMKDLEEPMYGFLCDLNLYNRNTPFSKQQWALVGVSGRDALFGISNRLERTVFLTTLVLLIIGISCAYFVARFTTQPVRLLNQKLRESRQGEEISYQPGGIREVDDLARTIRDLNRRQREVEAELEKERERYLLALESTTDSIFEYENATGTLMLYRFVKEDAESHLDHQVFSMHQDGEQEGMGLIVHSEDRILLMEFLEGCTSEAVARCKMSPEEERYTWFALKGRSVVDGNNLVRMIGSIRDVTAEKKAELREKEANLRDSVTKLYKGEVGERLIGNYLEKKSPLEPGCLCALDLDNFEQLNSKYGMLYCDLLLEELAALLLEATGAEDILLRYGGDEFLFYLTNTRLSEAMSLSKGLTERIGQLDMGRGEDPLTCSIGVSELRQGEEYNALRQRAFQALGHVKRNGKDGVASWEECAIAFGEAFGADILVPQRVRGISRIYEEMGGDPVSLAFNLFEKTNDLKSAIPALLRRLGRQLGLRAIRIMEVDQDFSASIVTYQWNRGGERVPYDGAERCGKEAFLTMLHCFEKNGVLFIGGASESYFPEECFRLLNWKKGSKGFCCAMYDNGQFSGIVAFEAEEQCQWGDREIDSLREIVRILSAHLSKSRADLASRAKSEFLSRMSHEIRTPINAITGMTAIASGVKGLPEKARDCLGKIEISSKYLLSLINDILDMARIESGKMKLEQGPFNLSGLLSELEVLIRPQAETKKLHLIIENKVEEERLLGDGLRLNQVLMNLLSNAVKFTQPGGKITVTAERKPSQDGKSHICFQVADTGIGISPENASRIFNAFEQAETATARKFGGTGLGLAISSNLVYMMGGTLELNSQEGEGALFYFTVAFEIDHTPQKQVDAERKRGKKKRDFTGCRLLLVEDNDLNIEIAREILTASGFLAEEARDGKQAVEAFAGAPEGYFDCILMDIRMPVMDGLEATRAIRRLDRPDAHSIPIIAMTANAFDEDTRKSIESGMNGHLVKPLDLNKLFALLEETIKLNG